MRKYIFLCLFTFVLSEYLQAQVDSIAIKKEILEKVKAKFKEDKKSLREFKFLGVCHCLSSALEYGNSFFLHQYSKRFNGFSGITRLMKEEILKNTFTEHEKRIKNFTKKEDSVLLEECYALYRSNVTKRLYKQMISDSSNYINNEDSLPFMYDYLKCGYVDFRRIVEGLWDFEKYPCSQDQMREAPPKDEDYEIKVIEEEEKGEK